MTQPYMLSIIVPVYNGAATVGRLVEALSDLRVDGGHEIILVDDGSSDHSVEVCQALVRKATVVPVSLVKLSRNFGEHNAVMAGFNHCRGNFAITMDDDLQNPPEEVLKLLNYAQTSGYQVVYTYYEKKEHSYFRNLCSRIANRTANFVIDKPDEIYLSSFRCVTWFVISNIIRYQGPFPYVDGLITQVTQSIGTVKVHHMARQVGRSNYTLRRLFRLWMSILVNFSTFPLRLISLFGLIVTAFGIMMFVEVIVEYIYVGLPVVGWGSLMTVILLFSGTQLIMLGVLGEYIGRLYQTANRKPQYVVENLISGGIKDDIGGDIKGKIRS